MIYVTSILTILKVEEPKRSKYFVFTYTQNNYSVKHNNPTRFKMFIVEITTPEECRKGRKWQKLAHIFIPRGPFAGCASDCASHPQQSHNVFWFTSC